MKIDWIKVFGIVVNFLLIVAIFKSGIDLWLAILIIIGPMTFSYANGYINGYINGRKRIKK